MSMQPQSDPVSENAESMLCSVTAALLRSVLGLRAVSLGAAAISLLGVFVGEPTLSARILLLASLVTTAPVLYLVFRIELDARLFERLATSGAAVGDLLSMDMALQKLGLVKRIATRPLDDRVSGARRLAMRALVAAALQWGFLCASAIAIALTK